VVIFQFVPYRFIEEAAKLRRVLEATLLIESDLDLRAVLCHVAEEARSMTGARYAAIGVLNGDHTGLIDFISVGLDALDEERIGHHPTGKGVLGLLIADPRPLRISVISEHADSFGFPAGHPTMTSFLGVTLKVRDEIYGILFLTDKIGGSEFTQDDQILVEALALSAGIGIENARLHKRVQEVAILEERDRLARDLHDLVIQRLFAVGLSLQSLVAVASSDQAQLLGATVSEIDDVIQQIRSTIYELGSDGLQQGLRDRVLRLIDELNPTVGFHPRVLFDGPIDAGIPEDVAENVLATIREAVTNIGRHAGATQASVSLVVDEKTCQLDIVDNGQGFDTNQPSLGGLGLPNLRRRAERLQGRMTVATPDTGGTALCWTVPVRN
jgi:signal transduction histidine kinase